MPADLWHTLPHVPVVGVGFHGRWFVGYDWIDCQWTGEAVVLTCGNDGPDWHGQRWCKRYVMQGHAANSIGQVTTRWHVTAWGDPTVLGNLRRDCDVVHPWADMPNSVLGHHDSRRFGTWLVDEDWLHHRSVQQALDWRNWTEGLPAGEVDEFGRVREQRRMGRYVVPRGTRTYFLSLNTEAANPDGADTSLQMTAAPAGTGTTTVSGLGNSPKVCWSYFGPAGEPDSAAWPSGVYDVYLDFSSIDSDVVFKVGTLGTAVGGFLHCEANLAAVIERRQQAESPIAVPGLHRVTYTGGWTAGGATDRWGITVVGERTLGHGNRSGTMFPGASDDSSSGPWPGSTATEDPLFFGAGP